MNFKTIDATGKQCPIPVVEANKGFKSFTEPGILEVLVDNETAVQNLIKLAGSKSFEVTSEKRGEKLFSVNFSVEPSGEKPEADEPPACSSDMRGGEVVAFSSCYMGSGSDELGAILMKGFIYALLQMETLPSALLFYNSAVKLSCEGSPCLEDLRKLESMGVEILSCGTCLDFFKLKDKLAVGGATNMYSIVEKLSEASSVIKP